MAGTVGDRIRARRGQLGLSQARLVEGLPLTSNYVSLIESGRRRPRERVLELLANRLECSVEYLTTGRGGEDEAELLLDLRFAELALASGDAQVARDRFQQTLEHAERLQYDDVRLEALWGRSRADEALGQLEDAIAGFLALAAEEDLPVGISRTVVTMHCARVYGQAGELDRAIEVGETALAEARKTDPGMLDIDEVTELASTLVGCYYLRGDLTQAFVLIREVIEEAEHRGSPRSRAAAYWNAGVVAEGRGEVEAALAYTERALALYGELSNARATAQLRSNYAWLLLRTSAPDHTTAEVLLRRSLDELADIGGPVDVATAETELARCLLVAGRPSEAAETAVSALDKLLPQAMLEAARARAVLGNAQMMLGDTEAAMESFTMAAGELSRSGADRHAAEVWVQLGEAMAELGWHERAAASYREAIKGVKLLPASPHIRHATTGAGTAATGSHPAQLVGAAEKRPVGSRAVTARQHRSA